MIQGYWKGDRIAPDAGPLGASKMVLKGRGKTQRGGQNAILVDIAHILQLQHPSPNPVIAEKHLPDLQARRRPRDAIASITPLPTHPFGIVCRHDQLRS